MVVKRLIAAFAALVLLVGVAAQAAHRHHAPKAPPQDPNPPVMQLDVSVGKNGPLFLNQLHDTAYANGFAVRVTPIDLPKKKHPKKPKHTPAVPPPPEPPEYTPMLIEIWRGDVKAVADNTKNEYVYHFDFHNWIFTPQYVTDKSLKPYRNNDGTPSDQLLHVVQAAATLTPGISVNVTQPEAQKDGDQSDIPSPLRQLEVTVSADHYRKFISELESFALENGFAVYSSLTGRGVHDSFYSEELMVTVTNNHAGDIEIALYEGDAGDSSKTFNAFIKGLKSIIDEIPYALVHEQKPYEWPVPEMEKESY